MKDIYVNCVKSATNKKIENTSNSLLERFFTFKQISYSQIQVENIRQTLEIYLIQYSM